MCETVRLSVLSRLFQNSEWAITVPFNHGMGWLSIPLPLFSIVSRTSTSPLCCACQRLSLLTSFEETWRHCFPEDRPEHRLYSTEESFVRLERHRDELRGREKEERGICALGADCCSSSGQCGDGSHRRASRSSLVSSCLFSR